MAEYVCVDCGTTVKTRLKVPSSCDNCGGEMITTKEHEARMARQEALRRRIANANEFGIEAFEWKTVDVGGMASVAGPGDVQNSLDNMADEGWEFVFFCDGPHLTAGAPFLIFRRRLVEESE